MSSDSTKLTKSDYLVYEKLKQKWKELSIDDIILDGLYTNHVRLVREYAEKVLKIDLKQSRVFDIGLKSVLQLLADKDLRGAEILLKHMNFESNQKIYQICFFTLYKQLRNYLITVLVDRNKLNEQELEMVEFIKKIEMVYSCRSFDLAKDSLKKFNWDYENESRNPNFKPRNLVALQEINKSTDETSLYSHFVIEWVRDWSAETKNEIFADAFIMKKDEMLVAIQYLDPKILLSILIDQNNIELLIQWIETSFSGSDTVDETSMFKHKLTQEMIDSICINKRLMPFNKEKLLNKLAMYNTMSSIEKEDPKLQLARLSSGNVHFQSDLFKHRTDEFHSKLILNFGKNLPANFIWEYLNFYRRLNNNNLCFNETENEDIGLKMLKAFREQQNNGNNSIVDLYSKNFDYVFNESGLHKGFELTDLFESHQKEYHLEALAISLHLDSQITSKEIAKVDYLFDKYPSIRLLFDENPLKQPDSLYNLLQNHSKLDMTKCFNWQITNKISLNSEASTGSLLSFEDESFVKKHAYKESLDFSYFVKQGRPFFAYHFFMSNQFSCYGKTNKTLMEEAKLRNNLILIENYESQRIVSACLTFAELMNADTFRLKLNVYMMKTLGDYYISRGMEKSVAAEKCRHIFTDFFKGDLDAKRLMTIFEQVLVDSTIENFDLKNMFTMDAVSIWLPLMCFCKIHALPYTCKYLQLCAESNEWLMFLIFAQMYQIPRYQVISSLEYFNDIGLKQHLEYALHNVINSASSAEALGSTNNSNGKHKSLQKGKKQRKTTMRNQSKGNESSDDEDSRQNGFDFSISSNNYQITLDSIDFYELLINCQNAADPVLQLQLESLRWYTPVLSIFATFYQQHDKISCLCTFLYSSLKLSYPNHILKKSQEKSKIQSTLFGLNELKDAIQLVTSKSYIRTLLNALKIFIPNTILDIYVEFLYSVFVKKDPLYARKLYQEYRTEFTKVTLNKHQSYIPLEWYEEVINKVTRITLLKCTTIDDLHNLNEILPKGNDYCRLIKLVDILRSNKISVNSEDWLDIDDKSFQFNDICLKVIEELLKMQKFNEAEELAEFCDLGKNIFHRIHLARIGRQIEIIRLNNDFEEILMFWKSSHLQLMKIGIKDSDFIDFLKFQNRRSNLVIERIVLLNLICQLCPNEQETSKNLWQLLLHFVNDHKKKNDLIYLKEILRKMLSFDNLKKNPIKELLDYIVKEGVANDFSDHNKTINEQDKESLNILLLNLVDIGKLKQAYVLAKYFKYYNQDLRILLNMLYICYDMVRPNEIDYNLHTFDTTSFKGIKLTNVLRSISRNSNNSDEIMQDRIESLERLAGLCNYGHKFCRRIKLDFRLASDFLNTSFLKVLNENEWSLLKVILYSNEVNKFELARQFVKSYDLNQSQLCDFMLKEVLNTLNSYVEINKNSLSPVSRQLIFNPTNTDEFSKLIKIFKNNSNLFGIKMHEKSRHLLIEAKNTDDYIVLTELLIRSHSFFSQSCSMEGISSVLNTSKKCATQLEKAGEFNIMIRLLTGIGHFSEMTYIMDFLWTNHQFEMLFGKGIGKNHKLRLALLDYLKRHHPNDHETYTMVTLNFTMHREIAIMLEEAAYQQLKLLENKTIENTPEILTDLQSILQYFSDAAQSFMKEDCVKQAESCIRKARLVALQINFLSMNLIVINLTNAAVSKFIVNHKKFWESYIVSEAYDKKSEWSQILFNQYILNNNEKYLNDFKAHISLTANMIEDIANRFKLANDTQKLGPVQVTNMKRLLKCSKDIGQYYRILSVLEFHDVMAEMQRDNNFSIVNDLLLNKKI